MQCFGYCMADADQAVREMALRNDARSRMLRTEGGLPAAVDLELV